MVKYRRIGTTVLFMCLSISIVLIAFFGVLSVTNLTNRLSLWKTG